MGTCESKWNAAILASCLMASLLLCVPGSWAYAQFDDGNIDELGTSMKPTLRPAARGETERTDADSERLAILRARKSKAKVVYEGLAAKEGAPSPKPASLQDSLVIKTELDYSSLGKKVRTERMVFVTEENKDWLNLTRPRDGVVVLGHLLERGTGKIKMEYIIVDTGREEDPVISPPPVESVVGQKTLINLDGAHEKISVTLSAEWRKL